MPVADMFVYSILDFWGMSEDLPWVYRPESQERYDWCIAQALKRRKDFVAVLETVVGAEQAKATKRPASSITSPPTQRKRQKKNCPFAIAQRRAEMGAESVEVICPSDTTPNLEDKIVHLLEACYRYKRVSSVELQCVPIGVFRKPIHSLVELIMGTPGHALLRPENDFHRAGQHVSGRLPRSFDRGRASLPDQPRPGRRARDLGDASDGISSRDPY